jgi:hypothetical protein
MKIVVFHGPDNEAKHELLAWLRGPDVDADARTVVELPPQIIGSVDDRVAGSCAWADKAVALVTPDQRSPSGAPNVIDEIGRWRGAGRQNDLAIVRQTTCTEIWSNLAGVVRIEFSDRVNRAFIPLMRFLGLTRDGAALALQLPQAIPLQTVLADWQTAPGPSSPPLFVVVGGSNKYDPDRKLLGLKEYQSTEPITGIVRVSRALSEVMRNRFIDAICDYSPNIRPAAQDIDLILVGAADTNRVTKEIFVQDLSRLPARFEPPTGSDAIVVPGTSEVWSSPTNGLVLALQRPINRVRYAIVCAGNGASGTNATLQWLASWLRRPASHLLELGADAAKVLQAHDANDPTILWPIGQNR